MGINNEVCVGSEKLFTSVFPFSFPQSIRIMRYNLYQQAPNDPIKHVFSKTVLYHRLTNFDAFGYIPRLIFDYESPTSAEYDVIMLNGEFRRHYYADN